MLSSIKAWEKITSADDKSTKVNNPNTISYGEITLRKKLY